MPSKLVGVVNGLMIAGTALVLLLAIFRPVTFMADKYWLPTSVLIFGSALLLFAIKQGIPRLRLLSPKILKRLLWISVAVVIILQFLVAWNFVDYGRADAYFVRNQAVNLAAGNLQWNHYFQVYTNNVNLVLFETVLIKFGHLFGLQYPWILMNIIQFSWLDCGLFAGIKIFSNRKQPVAALIMTWLWTVAVPIYAYGLFSYSDGLVMSLPLIVAALMQTVGQKKGWHLIIPIAATVIVVTFGVLIKGNLIILLLALVLGLIFAGARHRLHWSIVGFWTVGVIVGLIAGNLAFKSLAEVNGYHSNPNSALPMTSWVAMSLDPQTHGDYRESDTKAQMQLPTAQAKQLSEQQLIKQRLEKMGTSGLLLHMGKKAQLFAATGDMDSFRLTTQWQKIPQWYAIRQQTITFWLANWMQILYISMLVGSLEFLIRHPHRQDMMLPLFALGLATFHMLFWEVEERYALPLLPIIMLWASANWSVSKPVRLTQTNQRLFSWLMLPFLGFSLWSILGVTSVKVSQRQIINEQGAGGYFQATTTKILPGQTLVTKIQTAGSNNQLELLPRGAGGQVNVQLMNDKGTLLNKTASTNALATLQYSTQTKGTLQLAIANLGSKTVHYGVGQANYPLAASAIDGHSNSYLRYYVLRQTKLKQPPTLANSRSSWAVVGLAAVGLLGCVWWPQPDQSRLSSSIIRHH